MTLRIQLENYYTETCVKRCRVVRGPTTEVQRTMRINTNDTRVLRCGNSTKEDKNFRNYIKYRQLKRLLRNATTSDGSEDRYKL